MFALKQPSPVINKQESATYTTVNAQQCRHLANTFEVAAIECLTWVAIWRKLKNYDNSSLPTRPQPTIV